MNKFVLFALLAVVAQGVSLNEMDEDYEQDMIAYTEQLDSIPTADHFSNDSDDDVNIPDSTNLHTECNTETQKAT